MSFPSFPVVTAASFVISISAFGVGSFVFYADRSVTFAFNTATPLTILLYNLHRICKQGLLRTNWCAMLKEFNLVENSDGAPSFLIDSAINCDNYLFSIGVVLRTAHSDLCPRLLDELLNQAATSTNNLCDQVVWNQESKRYSLVILFRGLVIASETLNDHFCRVFNILQVAFK